VLHDLYALVESRKRDRPGALTQLICSSEAWTRYSRKSAKKPPRPSAAKNEDRTALASETSDLFYHLIVLLVERGVTLKDIAMNYSTAEERGMHSDSRRIRTQIVTGFCRPVGSGCRRDYSSALQRIILAERKADNSFVTVADRENRKISARKHRKGLPDDAILGEEEGEKRGKSNLRWILDPIDGTYSFVHGCRSTEY